MRLSDKGRKGAAHWYRIYVGGCPICGRFAGPHRERVYGKKPKDPRDRYVSVPDSQTYDYCDAL